MLFSELFNRTLREVPAEAETISHQLLLRAGLIRKVAAGIYTYLPLGYRVIRKIEQIVREEMDAAGGQELMMPIMQPAEMWRETGRWDVYGDEMVRLKDRHNREFCLGPTHEEMITSLVKEEINSYRQLPKMLYQMQNKYRDEIRPRFGLMRAREFIMKDLYSFDRDEAGLDISYDKMFAAYEKIFTRCGLAFRPVDADTGAIGGKDSHEFMVIADTGEAGIVYCENCTYSANVEKAKSLIEKDENAQRANLAELELVDTPNVKTISELETFFGVEAKNFIKTLIYKLVFKDKEEIVAILLRGDRELNEIKLKNYFDASHLELANEDTIEKVTGAKVGFSGPVGLKEKGIKLVADEEVMELVNAIIGANQTDKHYKNANAGRDFQPDIVDDFRLVGAGDLCPKCGGYLQAARGIEVGHIFKLGVKYSSKLGATFLDEKGTAKPAVMGCYGLGVGRTMAAAIEQNHDKDGIIWPMAIAPYHVVVVPVNVKDEATIKTAKDIYTALQKNGVEAILDDRDERPGVKFKDADLIGLPIRVVVGPKMLAENKVEIKIRRTGEVKMVELDTAVGELTDLVKAGFRS